jgi:hypothetical protein
MAAGEDQLQPLVRKRLVLHLLFHRLRRLEQAGLRREGAVTPDSVDRPIASRGRQPRARIGGRTGAGPQFGGDRERLLRGLLGEIEVAEEADQVGQDSSPLLAEDLLEQR